MAVNRPDFTLPTTPLGFGKRTLPSFNQFVSTLEGMDPARRPFAPSNEHPSTLSETLNQVPQARPHERCDLSNILNGTKVELSPSAPASHVGLFAPGPSMQSPQDVHESQPGHPPNTKALQPRGSIPPPLPASSITLPVSTGQQDLTLAGKPRKRSTQACHRCREMKIKCRLQNSGCATCRRHQLECRFETNTTGVRRRRSRKVTKSVAETATESDRPTKRLRRDEGIPCEIPRLVSPGVRRSSENTKPVEHASSFSPSYFQQPPSGQSHHPVTADFPPTPPTDHRDPYKYLSPSQPPFNANQSNSNSSSNSNIRPDSSSTCIFSPVSTSSTNTTISTKVTSPILPDLSLDIDPFTATPDLSHVTLRAFYSMTAERLGPLHMPSHRESCAAWRKKSPNERMLVYAMLAVGADAANGGGELENYSGWRKVEGDNRRAEDEAKETRRRFGWRCRQLAERALARVTYRFERAVVQTQLVLKSFESDEGTGGGAGGDDTAAGPGFGWSDKNDV